MANDVIVTVPGFTTAPAETRFLPDGTAVANFTVAHSPRTYDQTTKEWKDGTTTFYRVAAWRKLGEAVGNALLDKGIKVTVTGKLENRPYEKDGQTRYSLEINADEVAISLGGNQVVTVAKPSGGGGGQQQPRGGSQGSGGGSWGGGAPQQSSGGWGGSQQPAAKGAWG
jgi:single-strand DNA-binding protein